MNSTPQNAVLTAVDELHGVLSRAEALLLAGRQLDLQGLDAEVASICDAVKQLSPGEARAARPALSTLLSMVDGLHARLSGRAA